MNTTRVAVTLEADLVARLDQLVQERRFPSRSQAIQEAVREKLTRLDRTDLARECEKLNSEFEQQLADEGLSQDLQEWPDY